MPRKNAMSRQTARLCAVALTAVFLFAAPSAFAAGFGDGALELPDLASLWGRISSLWSGTIADHAGEIDGDLELGEKMVGATDPLGQEGADPPAPASSPTSAATLETQPPRGKG